MNVPGRLKKAVKAAEKLGWAYDRTKKHHPRLTPPKGLVNPRTGERQTPVIFSSSPSDPRSDDNGFALLKRHGIRW